MTYTIKVTWPAGATVRHIPSTASDGLRILPQGTTVHASEIVADQDNPQDHSKRWAHIDGNVYIATDYPNAKGPQQRATVTDDVGGGSTEPNPPPPPPAAGNVSAHIELNIDGTIYSGDGTLAKR